MVKDPRGRKRLLTINNPQEKSLDHNAIQEKLKQSLSGFGEYRNQLSNIASHHIKGREIKLFCLTQEEGIIHMQFIFRWLWLLLLVVLMVTILSIPNIRRKWFFSNIGFRGYDGKIPRFLGKVTVNKHLKKLRFKSKIPRIKWEKIKPDLEMFYKRRIYKMEQSQKNMRNLDIFLIDKALPSCIKWEDIFMEPGDKFAIGESYTGKILWDAAVLQHGLVAGATGSGKTGLLRVIIHQAILKRYNVTVFDFKGGGDYASVEKEARKYNDLKEGYCDFVIVEPENARQTLLGLRIEAENRLATFKDLGVSNISEYNARGGGFVPWLLVIDEAAELLDVKPKDKDEREMYAEIDHNLRKLARLSRATGIHILMGFIRPDANVLDGQIKNNLLWRACGYFADPAASRIVLDNDKATELPPEIKGRFIIGEEETQAYYIPIPEPEPEEGTGTDGEAERKPSARPAAEGGGNT